MRQQTPVAGLDDPLRRVVYVVALVYLFLRFGMGHELLVFTTGHSFYIVFLTSTAVTFGAVFSGAFQRTFFSRIGRWWLFFVVWMVVTTLAGSWITGAGMLTIGFVQVSLPPLLVIAGLALTLAECYRMMSVLALASLVNLFMSHFFGQEGDRLALEFGSIANSNDLAAHLLFICPFLMFAVMRSRQMVVKAVGIGGVVMGLFIILNTGSRGGLVALAVALLYCIVVAPMHVRIGIGALCLMLGAVALANLPDYVKERYATVLSSEDPSNRMGEAVASRMTREYLLRTSLWLTVTNPIAGVGPGQFADVEGRNARANRERGAWQVTHNSYTQVSSEMGIPGLIMFLGALFGSVRTLRSIRKRAGTHPADREANAAAFCLLLSILGFGTAIMFLSLAYSYYLPALTGFAIALGRAYDRESAAAVAAAS